MKQACSSIGAALVLLTAVPTANAQERRVGDAFFTVPGQNSATTTTSAARFESGVPRNRATKWELVQVETVFPSLSTLQSVADSEARVNVGGPLQSYAATNRVDLAGRMYDLRAPFGATAIVAVGGGRSEVHGGVTGVFIPFASPYSRPNSWLTQANLGFRFRLDSGSHLWLGGTAYYLIDAADKSRQWGSASADLTVRFGSRKGR